MSRSITLTKTSTLLQTSRLPRLVSDAKVTLIRSHLLKVTLNSSIKFVFMYAAGPIMIFQTNFWIIYPSNRTMFKKPCNIMLCVFHVVFGVTNDLTKIIFSVCYRCATAQIRGSRSNSVLPLPIKVIYGCYFLLFIEVWYASRLQTHQISVMMQ